MSKSFEKYNSTHSILDGEVKCSADHYQQYHFLTQGIKEREELFALILDDSNCLGTALSQLKEILANSGSRGDVSLADLQNAKTREEQHELISELFIHKYNICMLDKLIDNFSTEQIFNFKKHYGFRSPLQLLTFRKEFAIEHFHLN